MNGIQLIAAERQRQVEVEGWTPEHDDEHDDFELNLAAECYLIVAENPENYIDGMKPAFWPWNAESWRPSLDRVTNLVKAGALIAAEIDRLQRNGPW